MNGDAVFDAAVLGDAQAILAAGIMAAHPAALDPAQRFHSVVVPAGAKAVTIDLENELDSFRERPRYKKGSANVHDAASFVAYLAKHGLPETEVWANATAAVLVGVINAHEGPFRDDEVNAVEADKGAGRGDHRVAYQVKLTDAWQAWAAQDGKLLDQSAFAELIEERAIDIVRPNAADMLELAQTFQATIGVSFESSKLLSSGQRQLEYKETVESRAGRKGQLEIPKDFDLALVPFEGASPYKVTARFRYRITDGSLRVGYRLTRPADVLREAFLDVVKTVEDGIEAPVFRGVSP